MFNESDKVKIREYLGRPDLYHGTDPRLENAIQALQSQAEGGSRPDQAAENRVKQLLAKLDKMSECLDAFDNCMGVTSVSGIQMDKVRARLVNLRTARSLIGRLARHFDVVPLADVFSSPQYGDPGNSLGHNNPLGSWPV